MVTVIVECISSKEILRKAINNVSHHPTSENQRTRLGSVPNRAVKQAALS